MDRRPARAREPRRPTLVNHPPEISIVVPALNEGANLRPLVEQVAAALAGRSWELVIVDDASPDDTVAICSRLAECYPVRLLVRAEPTDGLSGAVLHGLARAQGDLLVVMDADLQHPPSALPALLAPLERGETDFSLGSRYATGGRTSERWSLWRRINSRLAVLLARPLAGPVRDPMSGFFALRRDTLARGRRLTPLGYKIGLELMSKCAVGEVREVPIEFAARVHGTSKLTLRERFRYLEHLSRLYDFSFPRASPIVKFLIVTALSWLAALGLFLGLRTAGVPPALTTTLAYLPVVAVTAVFHARYARTQRAFLVRQRPWRDFLLTAGAEWLVCAALAIYLAARLAQPRAAELFLLPFVAALGVRYVLRKELLLDVRGLRRLPRDEDRP
jgi:dolichol-phosphate mannosyltransferase